jgi:hypothetical protein
VDFTFDKFPERFLLAKYFKISGIVFYFPQQFSFGVFIQLVIQVHSYFTDEFLIVLISHDLIFLPLRGMGVSPVRAASSGQPVAGDTFPPETGQKDFPGKTALCGKR